MTSLYSSFIGNITNVGVLSLKQLQIISNNNKKFKACLLLRCEFLLLTILGRFVNRSMFTSSYFSNGNSLTKVIFFYLYILTHMRSWISVLQLVNLFLPFMLFMCIDKHRMTKNYLGPLWEERKNNFSLKTNQQPICSPRILRVFCLISGQ